MEYSIFGVRTILDKIDTDINLDSKFASSLCDMVYRVMTNCELQVSELEIKIYEDYLSDSYMIRFNILKKFVSVYAVNKEIIIQQDKILLDEMFKKFESEIYDKLIKLTRSTK